MRLSSVIASCALSAVLAGAAPAAVIGQSALKVVVIDGDEAANIVAAKLAAMPVVEVQDEQGRRVPGATVRFVIRTLTRRGANPPSVFQNGLSQITTVTDAAGRATVGELTPVANGQFAIDVQATANGQVASATIHQTNFANLAEAAKAGKAVTQAGGGSGSGSGTTGTGASGGGSGATGAGTGAGTTAGASAGTVAAAGGGGLSTAAIAGIVVGGAAGVGTAVAVVSKGSSGSSSGSGAGVAPAATGTLTAVASPNPAPFSGAPINDVAVCQGQANTWFYDVVVTETAGVAVTITRNVDVVSGEQINDTAKSDPIPARGSFTYHYRWCWSVPVTRVVNTTLSGTDANGRAISVTVPAVTLMPKAGFPITASGARAKTDPIVVGGGGARPR